MNQIILSCGCGNTDKFAKDAFRILFHTEKIPKIVKTMGIIKHKLLREVVSGLMDGREKYAYYLSWDDDVEVWDLLKGERIR